MKIERMNKGNWGKVRAFFDLTTEEGFTMKGFKLIEGINGLFISPPSQKGNDDEYRDTIWIESRSLRDQVNQLAIQHYNNEDSTGATEVKKEVSESSDKEPSPINENVADGSPVEEKASQPETFGDDDIPF